MKGTKIVIVLLLIWVVGIGIDRLWFSLDHSIPAWDQAEYLNGAINYYEALEKPLWLKGDWWRDLWLLSSKIPPLTYLLTVPFLKIWGTSVDAATLVMLPLSGILIVSVYSLGRLLFFPSVGLIAAIICQLLPGLYRYRLDYLLDFPLTVVVTVSFTLLSFWRVKRNYFWAIAWGVSGGCALLVKQPSLFFLFIPYMWLVGESLIKKKWPHLLQLFLGGGIAVLVCFPWYRTNWLLILTSGKRATIDSAIAEGDPALNTLAAWTYYGRILPYLVSWILLLIPILGLVIYWWRQPQPKRQTQQPGIIWLLVFCLGGYLLSSLNINKDPRYILPLLPALSILLALGLSVWKGRFGYYLRGVTLAMGFLLMLLNLYPLGLVSLRNILSPGIEHNTYLGEKWPLIEVIDQINQTSPYLHSTLGVLPSTSKLNQHNFTFYGSQLEFPVTGRQVGVREKEVKQDAASLDWFVTKSGDQGSIPESQPMIVDIVENDPAFDLVESWTLPDSTLLKLYHRQPPSLLVKKSTTRDRLVTLDRVMIPESFPPGISLPITYQWSGSAQQLQDAIVLLTWQNSEGQGWIHDHGIAMGRLTIGKESENLTVVENIAMFPDSQLPSGEYTLKATYLNRRTLETYPITTPKTTINLSPDAEVIPAPELDLITQLRLAAPDLALGIEGLDPIFAITARINQYDPNQDYLKQAEIAFSHRLATNNTPMNPLDLSYSLALAAVLQQDVSAAIRGIEQVIELNPENAYNYAYLAFVYLYDWRPGLANQAIEKAISLNSDIPEFYALRGISSLLQGNLVQTWRDWLVVKPSLLTE